LKVFLGMAALACFWAYVLAMIGVNFCEGPLRQIERPHWWQRWLWP
jgi:hypothetical protein